MTELQFELCPYLVALNHIGTSLGMCLPSPWALVLQTRVWSCSWAFTVLVTSGFNSPGTRFGQHALGATSRSMRSRRERRQRTVARHPPFNPLPTPSDIQTACVGHDRLPRLPDHIIALRKVGEM